MDWHRTDFTLVGPIMFGNDRWLGEFSSHGAALAGIRFMRDGGFDNRPELMPTIAGHTPNHLTENETWCRARMAMTDEDFNLLAAIDADEE
jgi:hypothetical protein